MFNKGQTIFVIEGRDNLNVVTEYVVENTRLVRVTDIIEENGQETAQTNEVFEFTLEGVPGSVFNTDQVQGYFFGDRAEAEAAARSFNLTNLNHYRSQVENFTKLRDELEAKLA